MVRRLKVLALLAGLVAAVIAQAVPAPVPGVANPSWNSRRGATNTLGEMQSAVRDAAPP